MATADAALEGFTRQMKRLPPGAATVHDLRPWQRDGLPPGTGATAEDRHLVLRSARPLAARQQREHQRTARASSSPRAPTLGFISPTELNEAARLMNQRPRKTFGWKQPEKAMAEKLAAFRSIVAHET